MANVSLIDPYSQKAEEIANRRRMAQALQEQGSQILDMPTMPGVAISPYAGLAKVLQAGLGAYEDKQARKEYADLQNEYRTNYNTQLGEMARLISAPEVKGVAGTSEIPYEPAQTEKIYGTKPAPVMGSGYGSGMLMPDQVIGEKVIKPEVPYQAAVAPVEARPAGYISAADLQKIDIPEVKQLLMAKYLKQFEPEQVKLGQNERLLQRTGSGSFTELAGVAPAKADKLAPHWEATTQEVGGKPVAGWINLNATDKAASFVAGAKPTEAKAAEPKWEKGQKTVDGKTLYGWYDLSAPNYEASFKAGAVPPAGNTKLVEVTRGGKVYYENPEIANVAERQAAAIEKETAKTPTHYSEIEDKGNIVIVDMNLPADQRLAKGQIKGPIRGNLKQISTNDAEGRPVTRWVDEGTLVALGDIPQQYTGLLLEMAQAGQLKKGWESDPRVAGVIRDNLINQSGGITPARLADIRVRIAEAAARLGDLGIAFDAKGLTPSLSNLTTLPSGSSAAAAPAAAVAKAPPKINDVVINGDKKFRFKGGDPNQQSNWVEVK
jgi:hypothetical protein